MTENEKKSEAVKIMGLEEVTKALNDGATADDVYEWATEADSYARKEISKQNFRAKAPKAIINRLKE